MGSVGQVLTVTNNNALAWTTPSTTSTTATTITTVEATTSEPILYPVMTTGPAGSTKMPYVDVTGNVLSYTPSTGDFSIGSSSLIASNQLTVKTNAIAIGNQAGKSSQGLTSIAIGNLSGVTNQGNQSVSIGYKCAEVSQNPFSIAIGYNCGDFNQGVLMPGLSDAGNDFKLIELPYSPTNTQNYWTAISTDATGQYVAAVLDGSQAGTTGGIWVSSNYGATWTLGTLLKNPGSYQWSCIAVSYSGNYMVACEKNGGSGHTWLSTNFGQTWNYPTDPNNPPPENWTACAISSNGQNILVVNDSNGTNGVWRTINGGANWSQPISTNGNWNWTAAAMSPDASKQVICANVGDVWLSTNYGATWTRQVSVSDPPSSNKWTGVSISDNGVFIAACANSNSSLPGIWVTTDSGATWTRTLSEGDDYNCIKMSSTGQYIAACASSGKIYISNNYGLDWDGINVSGNFSSITMSSNGLYMYSSIANNNSNPNIIFLYGTGSAIAIGYKCGQTNQGQSAIALGFESGNYNQGESSVAIGYQCGQTNQGQNAIAFGWGAGRVNQGYGSFSIGSNAGGVYQGQNAIAFGNSAGLNTQGLEAVAIGHHAGEEFQGPTAVAIGYQAGKHTQGESSIAIGNSAGLNTQGLQAVAIGREAGESLQGPNAVAIGYQAGDEFQGPNAVAIGNQAGKYTQGESSIAIGNSAGYDNQPPNSIIINAGNTPLNAATSSSFIAKPLRVANAAGFNSGGSAAIMLYNSSSGEIGYSSATTTTSKTFVINHPLDDTKHLVHACLEGPEAGVYYRGEGEIRNNSSVTILLPDYVDKLATSFTIQLTPIYSGKKIEQLYSSRVQNNSFTVYGENTSFYWLVHGKRGDINVEPYKVHTEVKGTGPYRWI